MASEHMEIEKEFLKMDLFISTFNREGRTDPKFVDDARNNIVELRKILNKCREIIEKSDDNFLLQNLSEKQLVFIESLANLNGSTQVSKFFEIISMLRAELKKVQEQKNVIKKDTQDAIYFEKFK